MSSGILKGMANLSHVTICSVLSDACIYINVDVQLHLLFSNGAFFAVTVPLSEDLLCKYGAVEVPESHAHVEEGSTQLALRTAAAA